MVGRARWCVGFLFATLAEQVQGGRLEPPAMGYVCARVDAEKDEIVCGKAGESCWGICDGDAGHDEALRGVQGECCTTVVSGETKLKPKLKPWANLNWTGTFENPAKYTGRFGDVSDFTVASVGGMVESPEIKREMDYEHFQLWMKHTLDETGIRNSEKIFSTVPKDLFGRWQNPFTLPADNFYNLVELTADGIDTEKAKSDWEATELVKALHDTFEEEILRVFRRVRLVLGEFIRKTGELAQELDLVEDAHGSKDEVEEAVAAAGGIRDEDQSGDATAKRKKNRRSYRAR